MSKSGCNETFIESEYEGIVDEVKDLDPLINWYYFLRDFDREQKKRFKDSALLAQDYYYILNMLRMFYKDLTAGTLSEVDDDGWSRWKENLYDSLFYNKYEKIEAERCDLHGYNSIYKIGRPHLQQFYGTLTGLKYIYSVSKGIFVTTSDFTKPAWDYKINKPIELYNGASLVREITELINN